MLWELHARVLTGHLLRKTAGSGAGRCGRQGTTCCLQQTLGALRVTAGPAHGTPERWSRPAAAPGGAMMATRGPVRSSAAPTRYRGAWYSMLLTAAAASSRSWYLCAGSRVHLPLAPLRDDVNAANLQRCAAMQAPATSELLCPGRTGIIGFHFLSQTQRSVLSAGAYCEKPVPQASC